MRVVRLKRLRALWERHPDAEEPLRVWYRTALSATWQSLHDVRRTYENTVEMVDRLMASGRLTNDQAECHGRLFSAITKAAPEAAETLEALERGASEPEARVREFAVLDLARCGEPGLRVLARLVSEGVDASQRHAAAKLLGEAGRASVVRPVPEHRGQVARSVKDAQDVDRVRKHSSEEQPRPGAG